MNRRYRLGYLVTHPIQYQAPMLRHIAASSQIDLTVLFLSDRSIKGYTDPGFGVKVNWDVPLLEGYRHVFLPALGERNRVSFLRPFVHGIWRHLKAAQLDALWIHGYAHQAYLRAVLLAKVLGIKVLLRGESNLLANPAQRSIPWARSSVISSLFKVIDGFLAIGTLNRNFHLHHKVPEERIFMVPYVVDNDFFQERIDAARPAREILRKSLGLTCGRPIVLYASKFHARKRAGDLLEAYTGISILSFPFTRKSMPLTLSCQPQTALASLRW